MIAQRNGLLCEVFVIDLSSGGHIYIVKSLKTTVINVLLRDRSLSSRTTSLLACTGPFSTSDAINPFMHNVGKWSNVL